MKQQNYNFTGRLRKGTVCTKQVIIQSLDLLPSPPAPRPQAGEGREQLPEQEILDLLKQFVREQGAPGFTQKQ
ncbi:MAG TPA: hypothetical protein DEP36_10580 [Gammaproteobacteria bacterium]|nr:hypothetical protein [Gammaproteobacteria bacterium]